MKRVILESPLSDGGKLDPEIVALNVEYARLALRDSLSRGEAPFASHLLYPQCLNDANAKQRRQGMLAGQEWGRMASLVVVYTDYGITAGMLDSIALYTRVLKMPCVYRMILPTPRLER